MLKSTLAAVTVCGLLAMAIGQPQPADAKWTRSNLFNCRVDSESAPDTSYGAIWNADPGSELLVRCAVRDTDRYPKYNITHLNIHGYDAHGYGNICAKACVTYYDSNGGGCGSTACSSGWGVQSTLSPALTYWAGDYYTDFGYIQINVPPRYDYGGLWFYSNVRGFYTDDV